MGKPAQDKVVSIRRATGALSFAANFILVATMKPCPCGCYGAPVKERTHSPSAITRYRPALVCASLGALSPAGRRP